MTLCSRLSRAASRDCVDVSCVAIKRNDVSECLGVKLSAASPAVRSASVGVNPTSSGAAN